MHPLLSCVDGRCTRPVLGTAGGSIGELLNVLGAVESNHWSITPIERIEGWMHRIATEIAPIYHHTDELGWDRATDGVALADTDDATFALALADFENHAVHGCGHLAGVIADPVSYRIRRGLAVDLLRTFFTLWRAGLPGFELEILAGFHDETEVLIDARTDPAPLVPDLGDQQRFVLHPAPATALRHAIAELIAPDVDLLPAALIQTADTLAEHTTARTFDRLAHGLPRTMVGT